MLKHFTLILFAAAALAADAPKALTTAERIAISALIEKSKALAEQQKEIERQYTLVVEDACRRAYSEAKCQIQQDGTLVKSAPEKETPKK